MTHDEAEVQYETRVFAGKGGLWIEVAAPGAHDGPVSSALASMFGAPLGESCLLLAEGTTPRLTMLELEQMVEATGEVLRGQAEEKRLRRRAKPPAGRKGS